MRFKLEHLTTFWVLIWSSFWVSHFTHAADIAQSKNQKYFEQLQQSFRDNKNWSFLPDGENAQPVSIKIGLGLVNQNINSLSCCKGRYLFSAKLSKSYFYYKNSNEPVAVLLPPVGGLKSITLNQNEVVELPSYDYVNGGIIIPLSKGLKSLNNLHLEFEIDSPAVIASGFWGEYQIKVGYMSDMIKKRDTLLFIQQIVPLMVGAVAILFAVFIFWISLESDYKTDQSRACIAMIFCWFLFCLFLSGILRNINPYFDALHIPMRAFQAISAIQYMAVIRKIERKKIRFGIICCFSLIILELICGLLFNVSVGLHKLQVSIHLLFSIIVFVLLLMPKPDITYGFKKLLGIFNAIEAIAFLNDGIKMFLISYAIPYPFIYFTRYTTSAFLFVNVMYTIYDLSEKRTLKVKRTATEELAFQIAHDVRSPLAALNAMDEEIATLPEEKRVMFRSAINRIRDIANNLLERHQVITKNASSADTLSMTSEPIEAKSVHLISSLLDQLITEKRMQFRSKIGVEIEASLAASSYGHFALVQSGEFKRVISNLINNSVEASGDTGRVTVSLTGGDTNIQIKIEDNGKGIPSDVLPKLMRRGETHGKDGGSGLGLYHAKTTLERWQGSLSLASTVGVGTTVTITIPKAPTPGWFVPSIKLVEGSAVVVLDDDSSIHQIWQSRLDSVAASTSISVIHCSSCRQVEEWVGRAAESYKAVLYLFDYELLGDQKNGLDLIESLHLQKNAILVTSRYEEADVRERCEKLGVRLIPKGMAGFVPISIQALKKKADAILLDDDKLVHLTWASIARKNQRSLVSFYRAEEFVSALPEFDTDTPVYIDSHLGDGVQGQALIPQVKSHGFKTVYLATGYEAGQLSGVEGLTAVVGKEPAPELRSTS